MKIEEFNKIKKFSEASGSISVVDKNFKMELNEYGLYEEIPISNEVQEISEDALFVSPNFNEKMNETKIADKLFKDIDNIKFDERLGYYLSTYVGHVNEGDFRKNASSGGFGTWIFKELFEKGLIDGVIHVKENKDKNSKILFKYDISTNIEEIKEGAKTKYYPVEFSEVVKTVKEKPGKYAFIGIPSFVYAMRLLCEKDDVLKERIIFFIGLICGHQKSIKFAESMAWQMGIKPENIIGIDFRHKIKGAPASQYGIKVKGYVNDEVKELINSNKDLFGQNWGHGYFKPIASDYTDDVFNETADIVLGDAWLREYTDDYLGNNIILVRNPMIESLILKAAEEKRIKVDVVSHEKIFESQSSHYRHTHDELKYRLYKLEKEGKWHPKKRVSASDKELNDERKKVQDLRQQISAMSHIKYKEAVEKDDLNIYLNGMDELIREYDKVYKRMYYKDMTFTEFVKKAINKINRIIKKK